MRRHLQLPVQPVDQRVGQEQSRYMPQEHIVPPDETRAVPPGILSFPKESLNNHIYQFLKKSSFHKSSETFFREANLANSGPQCALNTADGCLGEWWQIFWDVFNATNRKGGSEITKKYFQISSYWQREEDTHKRNLLQAAKIQLMSNPENNFIVTPLPDLSAAPSILNLTSCDSPLSNVLYSNCNNNNNIMTANMNALHGTNNSTPYIHNTNNNIPNVNGSLQNNYNSGMQNLYVNRFSSETQILGTNNLSSTQIGPVDSAAANFQNMTRLYNNLHPVFRPPPINPHGIPTVNTMNQYTPNELSNTTSVLSTTHFPTVCNSKKKTPKTKRKVQANKKPVSIYCKGKLQLSSSRRKTKTVTENKEVKKTQKDKGSNDINSLKEKSTDQSALQPTPFDASDVTSVENLEAAGLVEHGINEDSMCRGATSDTTTFSPDTDSIFKRNSAEEKLIHKRSNSGIEQTAVTNSGGANKPLLEETEEPKPPFASILLPNEFKETDVKDEQSGDDASNDATKHCLSLHSAGGDVTLLGSNVKNKMEEALFSELCDSVTTAVLPFEDKIESATTLEKLTLVKGTKASAETHAEEGMDNQSTIPNDEDMLPDKKSSPFETKANFSKWDYDSRMLDDVQGTFEFQEKKEKTSDKEHTVPVDTNAVELFTSYLSSNEFRSGTQSEESPELDLDFINWT